MDRWVFSFITGILTSLFWPALPNPIYLSLLGVFLWVSAPDGWKRAVSGILIGATLTASLGHWYQYWQYCLSQNGEIQHLQGRVINHQVSPTGARLLLKVSVHNGKDTGLIEPLIMLSWFEPPQALTSGDVLDGYVKLKPARGTANQGGFAYESWLLSKRVVATGYLVPGLPHRLQQNTLPMRQSVRDSVLASSSLQLPWLLALSVGDRSALTDQDWALLQRTGIGHLLAISGLHLGLVILVVFFVLRGMMRLVASVFDLPQRIDYHTLTVWGTVLVGCAYTQIAGANTPVVRAWLALLFMAMATTTRVYMPPSAILLFVLAILLVVWPFSILSVSLWLSGFAVSVLIFLFWRWHGELVQKSWLGRIRGYVLLQGGLSLAMLPITAFFFAVIPWMSFWLNLIAVPVVSLVLVPLVLVITISLFLATDAISALVQAFDFLVIHGVEWLWYFASMSGGWVDVGDIPVTASLLALVGLFTLTLPALPFQRRFSYLLFIPLASHFLPVKSDNWTVNVLDVGQGLSVVIQQGENAIIYDTGAAYPSGFNMANAVVLPFIASRGVTSVEHLFVSHLDNDHAGGLNVILDAFPTLETWFTHDRCVASQPFFWRALSIHILWPLSATDSSNAMSCVIRIADARHSVLLTGDIDKHTEQSLVELYGKKVLNSDILLAPHHGSDTSSSGPFIRAVSPEYVVFSEGFMNRWHFPAQKVVNRYYRENVQMLATSGSGQVTFLLREKEADIEISTFRQHISPLWYLRDR